MLPLLGIRKFLCNALLIAVLCGLARSESTPTPDDAIIAKIEGIPLTAPELALFIAWHKAEVATRLFGDEPAISAVAWQRRVNGRSAADVLKAAAIDDAIEAKLLQMIAVDHCLLPDASWAAFERTLAAENARRSAVVAAGKPIYGPRVFGAAQFYRKRLNDLRQELARKLAGASGRPSRESVAALLAARRAAVRIEIDARRLESLPLE
jgi:hypothetical protein